MQLPRELDERWYNKIKENQEATKMPYISTPERVGREEGLAEGLIKGEINAILKYLSIDLEEKFGAEGVAFAQELRSVQQPDRLLAIKKALRTARSVADLRKHLSD